MASPTPVLPEVGSTIVPPGLSFPSRSAASMSGRPIRSFTEPPGFRYSSLTRSFAPPGWMIAVMPAESAASAPSANGMKASEASTAPRRSCPCSRAFSTAIRTESTRLVSPPPIPVEEDPRRRLPPQRLERVAVVLRSDHDLDEALGQLPAEVGTHGTVEREDHAVRGHRIGVVRPAERVLERARDRDPRRVRVLDDHGRRQLELAEEPPRGRQVVEVVERQLL